MQFSIPIFSSFLSSRCSWCVDVDKQRQHCAGHLEGIYFLFHLCVYSWFPRTTFFFLMGSMNLHLLFTSIFACQGCSVVVCIFKVLLSSSFLQPLTHRQSHGQITAYEVTFWSHEENQQHSEIVSPNSFAASVNLSHFASFYGDSIIASVIAKNKDGESKPSSVLIPLQFTGMGRWLLNENLKKREGNYWESRVRYRAKEVELVF